jgi:hypothetical protein
MTRVTMMLALDPISPRADDKAGWAAQLVAAVEAGAPKLSVESYEIRDTLVYVRLNSPETKNALRKSLRESEAFMRLRARLGDLGARMEAEVDR